MTPNTRLLTLVRLTFLIMRACSPRVAAEYGDALTAARDQ